VSIPLSVGAADGEVDAPLAAPDARVLTFERVEVDAVLVDQRN
jgi:hypothetical protein